MEIKLWLKQDAEKQLEQIAKDVNVEIDYISGKKYIWGSYGESIELFEVCELGIANEIRDLIEKITVKDIISRGLREDGIYRYKDAILTAYTYSDGRNQKIYISGPNIEAVKDIYLLFRAGKISPEEKWE